MHSNQSHLNRYFKLLPKFSEKYDFRIGTQDDKNAIIHFIDEYWKKNHVLVSSPELMDWQHYDADNNRYNFIIAVDKETNEIHALQGFVSTSHFDKTIEKPIRWGCIWKNRDDIASPGLGLMVHWSAFDLLSSDNYCTVGISDIAYSLYDKLNYQRGICTQWYIINPEKETFTLVKNFEGVSRVNEKATSSKYYFKDIVSDNDYLSLEGDAVKQIPSFKSKLYYFNRFLKHPFYHYTATKICDEVGKVNAVFFWRECNANGAKCIRIVDYFGFPEALCGQCSNFINMLKEHDAEFIDFINAGIDGKYFEMAGFCNRSGTSLILANYFEPFLLENIDLRYTLYSDKEVPLLIFKGDSDQDRPNII